MREWREESGESAGVRSLLFGLQRRLTEAFNAREPLRIEDLLREVDPGKHDVLLPELVAHEVQTRYGGGLPEGLEAEYAARFPTSAGRIVAAIEQLRRELPARASGPQRSPVPCRKPLPACAAELDRLWAALDEPPDLIEWYRGNAGIAAPADILAALQLDQKRRWKSAQPMQVEEYLSRLSLPAGINWQLELVVGEFEARRRAGRPLSVDELSSRFPELSETLRQRLSDSAAARAANDSTYINPVGSEHGRRGRYLLKGELGEGAYGLVYRGYDEQLKRTVAIKVPLIAEFDSEAKREAWFESYLREAQRVAALNHDGLVSILDCGRTGSGEVYVVYRFVAGETLKKRMEQTRFSAVQSAELLVMVAEALQYAHDRDLVHQDVKPANIMLESDTGRPVVIDFGLAVQSAEARRDYVPAGTPNYMSPEQVLGQGHLISGRSDVFALGVILYQLLTGKKPFHGGGIDGVLAAVISSTPTPPRAIDPTIPAELERICLKALAKRPSDRFTAAEFAGDLKAWLQPKPVAAVPAGPVPVIFRGLRSFSEEDSDFFLDLLPGQRNRDGLPESIAFWKQRIEEPDAARTFSVGLIYGPSGCGKSSLVKAGLLPRLSPELIAIYLEATADRTEQQLCAALRRRLPDLPADVGLADLMRMIRGNPGRKVVIILDQFEQWLHGSVIRPEAELVRGLGQCDGSRLQVVLMIREDFFGSVSRLMEQLDTPIIQRQNCAMVDLFDMDHAALVLRKFGAVFGRLPEPSIELTAEQLRFMKKALQGLAEDRHVNSVRLSLFAELLRQREWTPATLDQIGGTQGVGVAFLEETFSSTRSDRRYSRHQQAIRKVLKGLLPAVDTEIRSSRQPLQTLQKNAGQEARQAEFAEIIRILDSELRLITPSEADGEDGSTDARNYQLTHDYLVPSLRTWLNRRQSESLQGRAELLLEERSKVWQSRREDRQLPSLLEYLQIRWSVPAATWTDIQRQLMKRAGRKHLLRSGSVTAFLLAAILGVRFVLSMQRRTEFAGSLASVNPGQLTERLQQADEFGAALDELLRPLVEQADEADATRAERLAAVASRLVLVRRDKTQVPILSEVLLSGELPYVAPIRERLRLYADELRPQWLQVLRDQQQPSARRFRAALGLAGLEGSAGGVEWNPADAKFIAAELSKSFAEYQPQLRELLRPMADQLIPDLDTLFDAEDSTAEQQEKVALALADYAGADGERLARLLMRANQQQTEILFPKVAEIKSGPVREGLLALITEQPDEKLGQLDRVRLGRRRASAAITLLRQGERDLYFDALRITDDPESLSQFVSRCKNWGVTAEELVESLGRSRVLRASATGDDRRVEARVMYGLLVTLGSYSLEQIAEADREPLIADLKQLYVEDPSAAVHSASGWLLRTWGREAEVQKLDEVEVPYDASGVREWFRLRVTVEPKTSGVFGLFDTKGKPQTFSLNFVVFPAGEYRLGSPEFEGGELDRRNDETPRTVKLSRPVALCDREVTWGLYDAFEGGRWRKQVSRTFGWELNAIDVAFGESWYGWMEFCRWLTSEYRGEDEHWQCYQDPELLEKDGNGNPRVGRLLVERGGFRLPTDAEWEVAARAGQRTAWSFGSDVSLLGDHGWFLENSGKRPRSAAVKPPGIGGLHDVQGNLYEWVHDWAGNIEGNSVVVDSQGAASGQYRVLRGGSWGGVAAACRMAFRDPNDPTQRNTDSGLRLALSPSVTSPEAKGGGEKPQAVD